jgi:photosystem II stability/assembly factor-like uncharacterized protein
MKRLNRFARFKSVPANPAMLILLVTVVIGFQFNAQAQDAYLKGEHGLQWRQIGPFRGGRALAVTGVIGQPNTYYFGAVAGGVWKTVDGGQNWEPLFDKQPIQAIGAIAVAASDPNVIYAGTGEACIRGNITHGDGVYKSTDAGKTWSNVGLRDTRHIGRVIIDSRNPDHVFVAALGHAYGPNTERGVFRSLDGGKTWDKVLYKDDKTGAIDVTFDPSNSQILFAALWEAYRTPYSLSSGGPGSGLYKSTDGGATWKRMEGGGLPKGILGRIGVSVSGADPNRVYAQVEADDDRGGLYRSDNGGEKWTRVSDDRRFLQRAWYYMHVFADPKNPDTVYQLNTSTYRSTDGGSSWKVLPALHGDCHGLWIDPNNPDRMIEGNDGGATISIDGGKTWSREDNQPTAQFYHCIADNRFPYYVYGAQQDNTTVAIASASTHGVIDQTDWYPVGGGESGYIAPDPRNSDIVYAGGYEGEITRFDKRTNQAREISPWPLVSDGLGAAALKHRWQWTAPIVISPHDPNRLYYGGEVLFETTDGGTTWKTISPDLTRNDKSRQQVSGGPITRDDTGTEYYCTIFTIAESPVRQHLIWVGTDDGVIHLTQDNGATWTNVTPKDMSEWSRISLIEASPFDAGTAYVAVDRRQNDDLKPYIYKTSDFGRTWKRIEGGIPDGAAVRSVREDPVKRGLLYAGTERGVFVSLDDGGHWRSLQLNLPAVPVHDLIVKNDDLVAATHGRSFWILDDISPLRQMAEPKEAPDVQLFAPRVTYRARMPGATPRGPVGKNPPEGAIIYYFLKSEPATTKGEDGRETKQEITLEILDAEGGVVRKYSNIDKKTGPDQPEEDPFEEKPAELLPAEAGMNRFAWDLRHDRPVKVPGGEAVFSDYKPKGPMVLPGRYQVRLTVAGKSQTAPLELKPDPRITLPATDLARQYELGLKLRGRINDAQNAINQMLDVRTQIKALKTRLGDDSGRKSTVAAADDLDKKIASIEEELFEPKIKASEDSLNYPVKVRYKLVALAQVVDSADAVPTQASYQLYEELSAGLDKVLAAWSNLMAKDLASLNEKLKKESVPILWVPPLRRD